MPPWATGCHPFATAENFLAILYCCFIIVAKKRSPKILVEINLSLCNIKENSILSCIHFIQSWTKYIEKTTQIQVELMNPQLRLRIRIFWPPLPLISMLKDREQLYAIWSTLSEGGRDTYKSNASFYRNLSLSHNFCPRLTFDCENMKYEISSQILYHMIPLVKICHP